LQKAVSEDCVCEPWTPYAQYKWKVEQELSNIANLNYVVVRPAIVYGPGDRTGLSMYSVSVDLMTNVFYSGCEQMVESRGSLNSNFLGLESHGISKNTRNSYSTVQP